MMAAPVHRRPMRRLHARSAGALSEVALSLRGPRPASAAVVPCRSSLLRALALAVPALLVPLLMAPALPVVVRAAPVSDAPPGPDLFRRLQLLTLACGRENRDETCRQARAIADPLLDQPRLSARCKDVLWTIREQAQVADGNSVARRERIDQAGRDVLLVCSPAVRPAATPAGSGNSSAPARPTAP